MFGEGSEGWDVPSYKRWWDEKVDYPIRYYRAQWRRLWAETQENIYLWNGWGEEEDKSESVLDTSGRLTWSDALYIDIVRKVRGHRAMGSLFQLPTHVLFLIGEFSDPRTDSGFWGGVYPECFDTGMQYGYRNDNSCPQCGLWDIFGVVPA